MKMWKEKGSEIEEGISKYSGYNSKYSTQQKHTLGDVKEAKMTIGTHTHTHTHAHTHRHTEESSLSIYPYFFVPFSNFLFSVMLQYTC